MADVLDGIEIELPCENCGRVTKKTIGWIKRNTEHICACGTLVCLDTDQFRREIGKVDRSLADFQSALKKFNK